MDRSGEGQSMRQYKVYIENYIAESFNLPMLDHPDALWQTGVMVNRSRSYFKPTV